MTHCLAIVDIITRLKSGLQITENKIYLVKHAKAWAPSTAENKLFYPDRSVGEFVCAFSAY